jgi:hypothetical protein
MTVDGHLHIGVNSDGEAVTVFQTTDGSHHALESDSLIHAEVDDIRLDVPLHVEED